MAGRGSGEKVGAMGEGGQKEKERKREINRSSSTPILIRCPVVLKLVLGKCSPLEGPHSQSLGFSGSRWGLRTFMSKKFPGDAGAAGSAYSRSSPCFTLTVYTS